MASINERNIKLGKDNQFQLILVGLDDSKAGNEKYIRKSKINFPGIKVAGLKSIADRLKIETRAAPRIALLKPGGEVVSNDDVKIINLLNELAPATKKRNSEPDKPAPKTYHAGEPGDFAKQQTFTNGVGMKMIRVPAGSFRMGDLTGEGGSDEKPVRTVELSGYHLAATEVTQGQWEAVMGTTLRQQELKKERGNIAGESNHHPMYFVNWDDAMGYCLLLTQRERAAGRLPKGYLYTLPTEAQWENACRAGTEGDHAGDLEAMAWHKGNSGGKTHPVGEKKPNAWGFHDMHGNVWEWCRDHYSRSYDTEATRNPQGAAAGSLRIRRGGGWLSWAWDCRSAHRLGGWPGSRISHLGFRPCLNLAGEITKVND